MNQKPNSPPAPPPKPTEKNPQSNSSVSPKTSTSLTMPISVINSNDTKIVKSTQQKGVYSLVSNSTASNEVSIATPMPPAAPPVVKAANSSIQPKSSVLGIKPLDKTTSSSSSSPSSPSSPTPLLKPSDTKINSKATVNQPNREGHLGLRTPSNQTTETALSKPKSPNIYDDRSRYQGKKLLQFAIWAHYMSYGVAILCFFLGIFAIVYVAPPNPYNCHIDGKPIHYTYFNQLKNDEGQYEKCQNTVVLVHNNPNKVAKSICCYPDRQNFSPPLVGSRPVGAVYVVYSLFIFLLENTDWGFGLYYPIDTYSYKYRFSWFSVLNVALGAWGCSVPITSLAGVSLVILGLVQGKAAYRNEGGDGGRGQRKQQLASRGKSKFGAYLSSIQEFFYHIIRFRPYRFYLRIYNEDKLSSYFWVGVFLLVNFLIFVVTLNNWYVTVSAIRTQLLNGTLSLTGYDRISHMNRKALRYGPPTYFAAWAKAFGTCLNFDCAMILIPITRLLLRKFNDIGVSFSKHRNENVNDCFARFFARPFTRYIPLSKNIEFHKIVALTILVMTLGHMVMHYCNLAYADPAILALFRNYLNPSFAMFKWSGAAFFTGSVIVLAMLMIFSAALDEVRMARYEIFFYNHHFFIIFFLFLFIHGPNTFYWTVLPVVLYLIERYLQTKRGNRSFLLCKVEYIPPVMAVYFRPVNKKHFQFREGQYLYLNCPFVSKTEWHPFTISSALDDLNNGPRIDIITGEEVMEVPRPKDLHPDAKWRKYCRLSEDWRSMDPKLYLDKSDTAYLDYVSCHIKVHGLDDSKARTWTRRVKDYFELLQGADPGESRFPIYFFQTDDRGEHSVGKSIGPDGHPILRVDGPHSAPSEHYLSYNTVMIIGAGIGLTPCASILCALTKYRWKKNYNPEILHFYWIVRQNEIESFQWLVHMLTDISFELKTGKDNGQIEGKYYCEINIYVTGCEKKPVEVPSMHRAPRPLAHEARVKGISPPAFTAQELFSKMINPTVDSKGQVEKMSHPTPSNRLGNIWIWNGRPMWDDIFADMKSKRQTSDIGVCFCGAPVIGADLKTMCEKYSCKADDVIFNLHKENF